MAKSNSQQYRDEVGGPIAIRLLFALVVLIAGIFAAPPAISQAGDSKVGIVVMHGKSGSPARLVSELASALDRDGILVANLEMPWSGRRQYDVNVSAAEAEVDAALSSLRSKGAQKLFVAGHSQGGVFALYYGSKHPVNGIIAIAPGGDPDSPVFRDRLGSTVALARKLVADGKGEEKAELSDFEGSRGLFTVNAAPSVYLTWFEPDGAMNQLRAMRSIDRTIPVLYIVPTNDYPGLLQLKNLFGYLPRNPHTRLYEPRASHREAPSASSREIAAWTAAVAKAQ